MKDSQGNYKKLWKTLSSVLCRDQTKSTVSSDNQINAQAFSNVFKSKVESVRSSASSAPRPEFLRSGCAFKMEKFVDIGVDEARRLVRQAADKNCALDPAPTGLLRSSSTNYHLLLLCS